MTECIICKRSFMRSHLVDGDWCIDCWDEDNGSATGQNES
jgi:hypothetical protein